MTANKPTGKASVKGKAGKAAIVDKYALLFSPLDYLNEYYRLWDAEDEFFTSFIHSAFESIAPQRSMIDVGGGPTLYQLISARNKVDSITFAEYLECNRREIEKWKHNNIDAFDWDPYFKQYLKLEGQACGQSVDEMKACVRAKLKELVQCDLNQSPPIPGPQRVFDIVSCHCCIEVVCKSDEDLVSILGKLVALARPGGYLIMSCLKDSACYQVGDLVFDIYPIDHKRCLDILRQLGCDILKSEDGPIEPGRNYHGGTFALFAKKTRD